MASIADSGSRFGSPAIPVGSVTLRPDFAIGLPLSDEPSRVSIERKEARRRIGWVIRAAVNGAHLKHVSDASSSQTGSVRVPPGDPLASRT